MDSRFGYDGEQSTSRLEILLEASGVVGTWEWDHAHRTVTYDHGGALYLTGDRSLAGRLLKGHEAMTAVHRDDYDKMIQRSVEAAYKGGIVVSEYRVNVPGKGLRWILSRGRTYQDADGKPIRSHGILIDITDSHGDGRTYVMRADIESIESLDVAADHLIAAREILKEDAGFHLIKFLDAFLMEAGRLIARRMSRHQDKKH